MSLMNLPVANEIIDAGSLIVLFLIALGLIYRYKGGSFHHFLHWNIFPSESKTKSQPFSVVTSSFFTILFREVFAIQILRTCSKAKRASHLSIFWGFVFLGISTTLAFFTNPANVVLPLYNPVKIFGNVGGVLIVAGFVGMFYSRYREGAPVFRLTRSDAFLLILFLAVVTGFVTQQTIYSSAGAFWISGAFWIHMIFVIALLATAPFTKFFHAVSKPVSLLYEEMESKRGVEPLLPSPVKEAVVNPGNEKMKN